MKKYLIFMILFLLFPFTMVEAKTLVTQTQNKNEIETTLRFEEGYVGGLDITFKINGNVQLEKINWSSTLNNVSKNYLYNKENETIRILITTGNNTKNLLDERGILSIGTFVMNGEENTKFSFSGNNVTIIDMNYQSQIKNDLEINSQEFTIGKETTSTPSEEKPNPDDSKEENPKPSEDQKPDDSKEETPSTPSVEEKPNDKEENQSGEVVKPSDKEENQSGEVVKPSEDKKPEENSSDSKEEPSTPSVEEKPNDKEENQNPTTSNTDETEEEPSKEESNDSEKEEIEKNPSSENSNSSEKEESTTKPSVEEEQTTEKKRNIFEEIKYRLFEKTEYDGTDYLLFGIIVFAFIIVLTLITRRNSKKVVKVRPKTILDEEPSEKEDK